ncbi:glycosyltransferase family 4 protein [Pseudoponticoccus marisrubri]|uniref:Glycosyl transferase n=1 Tax=Pseudoponticoccus marisrubri TaxID=1685382 RepID=A0A0W7WHP6_9RHOB|nr:glycosyltransferase family 4 protein [Pseudoponticoccus marisrubri]KUF10160.1 glycosyl transferase [Pseudoponticoccus marisrubri]
MTLPRLRIAYLCDHSPLDRNMYSGGNARIHDALQEHVGDVTILSQGWSAAEPLRRLIMAAPDRVTMRLRWRAHLALRRVIASGIERELRANPADMLFGAYAFHTLAGLRVPPGMITAFTSDATPTVYRLSEIGQAYRRVFPLGRLLDDWVERQERAAFRSVDLLLWPSRWLWHETQTRYDLDPDRCHLVPWGANIPMPPPPAPRAVSPGAPIELLVIGRDWFAKGGPVAFDTMQQLRAAGLDARLTVIGCVPPEFHRSAQVTVHPQLNKSVPEELATFEAALARAHFLVQPSVESYGFAFCEASAHGLPSLCLEVGGVPVWDGQNGHALPLGSDAAAFARLIRSYIDDPARYVALCRSARDLYEARLNWDAWGRRVAELVAERRRAV